MTLCCRQLFSQVDGAVRLQAVVEPRDEYSKRINLFTVKTQSVKENPVPGAWPLKFRSFQNF